MRWFADNSELRGIREADIPDILIFGGIAISDESEKSLKEKMEEVKISIGFDPRIPLKWNFKSLKKLYIDWGKEDMYNRLLSASKTWRELIFTNMKDIDYTIIIAAIESYSKQKEILKKMKMDLTQYVFCDGLTRFALHVKEQEEGKKSDVVLDWPDRNCPDPFNIEYTSAYWNGMSSNKCVEYYSGSLRKLQFSDSILYSSMIHSTLLQYADLIVGASKEFFEMALGKRKDSFGVDMLKYVFNRFRGWPDKILGRGISISTNNVSFRKKVEELISEIIDERP